MKGAAGRPAAATGPVDVAAPRSSRLIPTARQRQLGLLAIGFSTLIWGLGPMMARLALSEVQPFTLAALRLSIAGLAMLPLALNDLRRAPRPLAVPWPRLVLLGVLGMGIFYLAWNVSLLYASTIEVGLIFATAPAVTALMAMVFLSEGVTGLRWAGIILSIMGVCLLSVGGSLGDAPNPLLGGIISFVGVLAWGGYVTLGKTMHPRLPQMVAMQVIVLGGALLIFPLAAAELYVRGHGPISASTWLLLVFLGVVNGAAAYVSFNWGLRYLEASTASTVLQGMVVVTVAAGVLVLGEPLTVVEIAAGATVLSGVWLASRPTDKASPRV